MTIRVEETYDSRKLTGSYQPNQRSLDLEFMVFDDTLPPPDCDPETLGEAVADRLALPPYGDPLLGLRLQTITLKELTPFASMASVRYGVYEPPAIDQIRFGFTTAGDTETITHSLATLGSYPATGEPYANFGNAIQVTDHGIQGTKRGFGKLKFWVTGYLDPDDWNAAVWLTITQMCYTWNLSPWHGWPAKTILFEYCECPEVVYDQNKTKSELVPVKFYFQARATEAVNKGNGIAFSKDPWDYTWDDAARTPDNAAHRMAYFIRQTNREQLYAGSDFLQLGLGQ